MTAQSQHGAPPTEPPASATDADADAGAGAGGIDLRREVDTLPDGRRITYYGSATR